ncbi:MAG TPA: TonB family protein [Pyrinomonadaceae bacterium]|nr:TonB family protein [Pyrinomonadaceae bacterium]
MQSSLLRLAVALLAFGLGVSATMFWIAYRTPDVSSFVGIPRHAHPFQLPPPLPTIEEELPPAPPLPHATVSVSGEVLNYDAINLPVPVYPSLARAARPSGRVVVRIVVGGNGHVEWCEAVSGHPLLRKAAIEAARQARFEPTLLTGNMGRVDGTLSYDFLVPPHASRK